MAGSIFEPDLRNAPTVLPRRSTAADAARAVTTRRRRAAGGIIARARLLRAVGRHVPGGVQRLRVALPPSPPLSQIEYGPEGQSIGDCAEWCGNAVMGNDPGGADTCALGTALLDMTPGMEMRCGFVAACGAGLSDTRSAQDCSTWIARRLHRHGQGRVRQDLRLQRCHDRRAVRRLRRQGARKGGDRALKDYVVSGGGIDFTLMSEHSHFYASDKPCKIDTYEVKPCEPTPENACKASNTPLAEVQKLCAEKYPDSDWGPVVQGASPGPNIGGSKSASSIEPAGRSAKRSETARPSSTVNITAAASRSPRVQRQS